MPTVGGRGGADVGRAARDGAAPTAADRHAASAAVREGAAAAVPQAAGGEATSGQYHAVEFIDYSSPYETALF